MSYENPEKRLAFIQKEILDPNSEIYIENLLDLAVSVTYDIHSSGTWKNSKPIKSFLDRYTNFSDKVYKYRVSVNDFDCLKTIGQGGFGRVDLVRHKQTKDVYAMKVIEKTTYIQNAFNGFWEERDILAKNISDWLVKCFYSFMDLKKLYIVMEYMPGGNLYHWLMTLEEFNEEQTHFYALEMLLAVETLHAMSFLHRDLKPDNMLLDRNGHLKLADFGTCIKVTQGKIKTNFQVGTPDYIAPEVLSKSGTQDLVVGFEIDWWAFGIVIFELFYGETPFEGESTATLYKNIMCYKSTLAYPDDKPATKEFLHFLQNILTDPGARMMIDAIKCHPYVANSKHSWNISNIRQHSSPLLIEVSGDADTQYVTFDPNEKRNNIATISNNNFFSGENLAFTGFTFNRYHQYGLGDSRTKSGATDCQELSELSEKISEIELSKQQLTSQLEKKIAELNLKQTKLSVAERDLVDKELVITTIKNEQAQTSESNKQLRMKLDSLSKQHEAALVTIEQLKLSIAEKESLIKNMKVEIGEKSDSVTCLKNSLQKAEQGLANINLELEEKVNQIEHQARIEGLYEEEKNNAMNLASDINMKNRKIAEYEQQLESLNLVINEISSQNTKISSPAINNNERKEELVDMQTKYERVMREKQAYESKMNHLSDDFRDIQNQRDLLRSELKTEHLKKTASEKTRDKLNKDLTEKKNQINAIQNKVYETEDQMRVLKQRINIIESEKDQLEQQCKMQLSMAELKRAEYDEIQAELVELKETYEKRESELEMQNDGFQRKVDSQSSELNKLRVECNEQRSRLDTLEMITMEKNQLTDMVAKLKSDIAVKKTEIEALIDKNKGVEVDKQHAIELSMSYKLKVDALVLKIDQLVNNPETVQRYIPRRKKETVNKESGKRIKELEQKDLKNKAILDEKMHEVSDLKNELQLSRDKNRDLEGELDKERNTIKYLMAKLGDSVAPSVDEDATMTSVMTTFLEGRIEMLKKGKGRHKISWQPAFAILQPFRMEIFGAKNDQMAQQTIELRAVMHVKETTQVDCVHIERDLLCQMLSIIYSKEEPENARRQDLSRRTGRASTLSVDEVGLASRGSTQDLSAGIIHVENHSFIQMRFRAPQACELCHQPCSDILNPPPALECSKCKKRIHQEHVGGTKIPSCQGAIEVLSIRLESSEAKVAWLQRFQQLKRYQKTEEVAIAPNTFYRSVRPANQRISPSDQAPL